MKILYLQAYFKWLNNNYCHFFLYLFTGYVQNYLQAILRIIYRRLIFTGKLSIFAGLFKYKSLKNAL